MKIMKTFSVLTLNIRHGQGAMVKRDESGWYWGGSATRMREHASRIGTFIVQQHPTPDIVCVQETNAAAFFWPDILTTIQIKADYPYVATASRNILPHNNAIVSRLPITRVLSRQFSALRALRWGPKALFYSANRGFVAAEIEGIGTIASTHLGPHLPALRLAQARELRQALPARNVILAGDFNPLAWDEESLTAAGEGFAIAPPIDAEQFTSFATWPAGATSTEITPEFRLDYLFVSPEFRIISAERVLTGHTDHYGVAIVVERHAPQ